MAKGLYFNSRSTLAADQLLGSSAEPADWPKVWVLLEPVFRDGETYSHDPAITEDVALAACVKQSQAVMVAADAAVSHVANAVCASTPCRQLGGWASG